MAGSLGSPIFIAPSCLRMTKLVEYNEDKIKGEKRRIGITPMYLKNYYPE
jgi:hypothetical protein